MTTDTTTAPAAKRTRKGKKSKGQGLTPEISALLDRLAEAKEAKNTPKCKSIRATLRRKHNWFGGHRRRPSYDTRVLSDTRSLA